MNCLTIQRLQTLRLSVSLNNKQIDKKKKKKKKHILWAAVMFLGMAISSSVQFSPLTNLVVGGT